MVNSPAQLQNNPQIQPQPSKKSALKNISNTTLDVIGIEFLILVIISICTLFILNYFSIIPLSKKFPHIFGFLPSKNSDNSETTVSELNSVPSGSVSPQIQESGEHNELFTCPVTDECLEGKRLYNKEDKEVKGLGFIYIPPGHNIRAIIDGKISQIEKIPGTENGTRIVITSDDESFVIEYFFSGKLFDVIKEGSTVRQAQELATSDGGALNPVDFTAQTYSLYIEVTDRRTNLVIPLIPNERGTGLSPL